LLDRRAGRATLRPTLRPSLNPRLAIILLLALTGGLLLAGLAYLSGPHPAEPAGKPPAAGLPSEMPPAVAASSVGADDLAVAAGAGLDVGRPAASLRIAGGGKLLAGLAAMEGGADREAYLDGIIGPLASLGPEAALAQVQQLADAELRDMAMLALLQEWSGVSTLELIRSGDIWRFGTSGALGLYLLEQGSITADEAAQMARASTDANRRAELLARVGARLATENPAAAMALADGLDDRQSRRFAERLAAKLAEESPEAARQFAWQWNDPGLRSTMLGRILETEAAQDPAAAARGFLAMPPDEAEARARAARRIGSEWASRDTLAALQWADSVGDASTRDAARQGIGAVAPVGIGARLTTGEGGVPVLQDLVPGGPASVSGQLQAGDRIIAVGDANGRWVEARKVELGDVVDLIRGEPNTQVSLQIQSPGDTAPRAVTLGRRQIIHRP
jgi:hypothetical protein